MKQVEVTAEVLLVFIFIVLQQMLGHTRRARRHWCIFTQLI